MIVGVVLENRSWAEFGAGGIPTGVNGESKDDFWFISMYSNLLLVGRR